MMKKLALTTALALTMGISAVAQAHPNHAGYATSSTDTVWKTSYANAGSTATGLKITNSRVWRRSSGSTCTCTRAKNGY